MNKHKELQPDDIPFLKDLTSFYKHVSARPPLDKDFDIREIDPNVLRNYDYTARPFYHSFYCITFLLEGNVTLNSGFWKMALEKPALYFKTPYQLVSWVKPERWLKEYFVVFTERFIQQHKPLEAAVWQVCDDGRYTARAYPAIRQFAGRTLSGTCTQNDRRKRGGKANAQCEVLCIGTWNASEPPQRRRKAEDA